MTSQEAGDRGQAARRAAFDDVYWHLGWARLLPEAALVILDPLVRRGPLSCDDLESSWRPQSGAPRRWDSTCWEPLHAWTDEELRALDRQLAGTPFASSPEGVVEAESVRTDEREARRTQLATMDAQSAALGLRPVRTLRDLLDFMVATGLVTRLRVAPHDRFALNPHAPVPGEVLPLSEERTRQEDELRWRILHERTAQRIVNLFGFGMGSQQPDVLHTSLDQLAARLDLPVDSVRSGVLDLLSEGHFRATVDVECAEGHLPFDLSVDRDAFARGRFTITIREGDGPRRA